MATQKFTTKNSKPGDVPPVSPRAHAGPVRVLAPRPDRIQIIRPKAHPSARASLPGSLSASLSRTVAPMVVGVPSLALLAAAAPVAPILIGVQVMSLVAVGGYLALHAFQAADDLVLAHQTRGPQEVADRPGYTALGRFVAAARAAQGQTSRLQVDGDSGTALDLSFPPPPTAALVEIPTAPEDQLSETVSSSSPLFRPPTIRPPIPR